MTRPSAKRTDLAQGNATSEAAEQVAGDATLGNLELGAGAESSAAGDAPATDEPTSPFPAAVSQDSGVVPAPEEPQDKLPVPAKTADQLQFEARLERLFEEKRIEQAQRDVEMAELRAQLSEMAAQLGRTLPAGPSEIKIRGTSVNQDVFARGWARRVPGRNPEDAPILGKTFKVIPQGQSAKIGMPIAIVTNVADAADAKAHYAMKLGRDGSAITATVQPLSDSAAA